MAYGAQLTQMLAPYGVSAELFGSTDLEIAGKGEWEFAIWVEIIAMRGERAAWNRAFMGTMRAHPEARQVYEQGKSAHACSKRAYMRWKDGFIADVLESL